MNAIPNGYVRAQEASKFLHVSGTTLRYWATKGRIKFIRGEGKRTHRYYDIKSFIDSGESRSGSLNVTKPEQIRRKICYCRVSTRNQKDDLGRQEAFLREKYPDYEVIRDIGSGLNFKRKGLKTILEFACRGELEELVVAYKDRLCRFGFDLVEFIIEKFSNGRIVILNNRESSKNEEFVSDILSIITVFSARINGLRKYRTSIQTEFGGKDTKNDESKIQTNNGTEEHPESMVRGS